MYKILVRNQTKKATRTFKGIVHDTVHIEKEVSGVIEGSISGVISGEIATVNYVASNMVTYSGICSGIISGVITDTISGTIKDTVSQDVDVSGLVSETIDIPVETWSFLENPNDETHWETNNKEVLKDKLKELYRDHPECIFVPIHLLKVDLNMGFDGCPALP